MLILGPDGLLLKHRQLMPTFHERTWHVFGNGDDVEVVATPFGRVSCQSARLLHTIDLVGWMARSPWAAPSDVLKS